MTAGHLGPRTVALVGLGGVAGALARHGVAGLLPPLEATLVVNVVGSFVLGVVLYEAIHLGAVPREARLVVATGFLSSLTTYSTFAVQTVGVTPSIAAANVAANYCLGFVAVAVGRLVALRVAVRRGGDGSGGVDDGAGLDGGADAGVET